MPQTKVEFGQYNLVAPENRSEAKKESLEQRLIMKVTTCEFFHMNFLSYFILFLLVLNTNFASFVN